MALINCPDCSKEISSNAPTCPGCGAPIATKSEAAGSGVVQLQTIQSTSKALKAQALMSGVLLIIGFVSVMAVMNANEKPAISLVILIVGTVWFIATRARIWWHHK